MIFLIYWTYFFKTVVFYMHFFNTIGFVKFKILPTILEQFYTKISFDIMSFLSWRFFFKRKSVFNIIYNPTEWLFFFVFPYIMFQTLS